jgi:hypothetical protein
MANNPLEIEHASQANVTFPEERYKLLRPTGWSSLRGAFMLAPVQWCLEETSDAQVLNLHQVWHRLVQVHVLPLLPLPWVLARRRCRCEPWPL